MMSLNEVRKLVVDVNLNPHQVHYWNTGEWLADQRGAGRTFVVSLRAVVRAVEAEKRTVQIDLQQGSLNETIRTLKEWLTRFGIRYQFNQSFNFPSFWLENGSQIKVCDPFKPADPKMGLDRPDCRLVD